MPPTPADADRLLKDIHPYLARNIPQRILDDMGWPEFLENRPITAHAPSMACHVFCALGLNGGHTSSIASLIPALMAFLHGRDWPYPEGPALRALKALLEKVPVNHDHIHEWFHRNYA